MIQHPDFINIDDPAEDIEESQKDALVYVAGYVGKMTRTLSCTECSNYFVSSTNLEADVPVNAQEYFNFKNRGGLKMPTNATITISNTAAHVFQNNLKWNESKFLKAGNQRTIFSN